MATSAKYILYADDDPDDQDLMHEAMAECGSGIGVIAVHNGIEALDFLAKLQPGEYYPSIIILDINMPVVGGYQTLKLLKLNPKYAHIPVSIFSTSSDVSEIIKAKRFGAHEYIIKPMYYQEFLDVCGRLIDYCSSTAVQEVG